MSDNLEQAAELAAKYRETQKQVFALEAVAERIKDELRNVLPVVVGETQTWTFGDTRVTWLKASESERLDKTKLVRLGVTKDILDAATVKIPRQPGFRIE